jgi:hypothetical protein
VIAARLDRLFDHRDRGPMVVVGDRRATGERVQSHRRDAIELRQVLLDALRSERRQEFSKRAG